MEIDKTPDKEGVFKTIAKLPSLILKILKFISGIIFFAGHILKKSFDSFIGFNRFISPKQIIPDERIIFFSSMFIFSFMIIALETLQFHMLSIVSDYLHSTMIISLALLGIAIGGVIAYYCGKFNFYAVAGVSAALSFLSIIYSYYNIINIEILKYPYFLVFPFIFSSVIVSSIFIHGNSNFVYFTNLFASACGVLFPVFLVPLIKSENCLFLLLFIPVIFFFILSLRIAHLVLKLAAIAIVIFAGIQIHGFIEKNIAIPERISGEIYEKKILPEVGEKDLVGYKKNIIADFFTRVYSRDKEKDRYYFVSDAYDLERSGYFLGKLGFTNRYRIPLVSYFETPTQLKSIKEIPAEVFEHEIMPLINSRYGFYFDKNYDRLFLDRVYSPDKKTGNYVLNGTLYDRLRAKYLLSELGHLKTIDMMFDIRPDRRLDENRKIYNKLNRVLLSEDSLLGRVEYTGDDDYMNMSINGVILDGIDGYNGAFFDPRVPHMDNADIFIVGLSADGIVKSAKRLPGSKVSGIELNPVIMRTMQNGQFADFAHMPYENVKVYYGEGRSFLESTDSRYDIISLMNIHSEHSVISTLSPENFHTIEGTKLLLNRLTDRGMVDYEEITGTERTDFFLLKFMNTVKTAMAEIGIKNPGNNIFIYRWGFTPYENVFRTIFIKRTPFTTDELKGLDKFIRSLKDTGMYYNIEVLYSPDRHTGSSLEKAVLAEDFTDEVNIPESIPTRQFIGIMNRIKSDDELDFLMKRYVQAGDGIYHPLRNTMKEGDENRIASILRKVDYPVDIDLKPVTDDNPFPFNVYKNKSEVWAIIILVLSLSLVLIIPVFFLIVGNIGKYRISPVKCISFAALTGFGYMLVEIVLMQKFQKFIGNPNYTMIIILGGMLFFSGIGSFVSRYMSSRLKIILVLFIPVLLVLKLLFLDSIFFDLAKFSFNSKLFISLGLIVPVSFLIGIPFPNALEVIKKDTSAEFSSLMFGISGFFSTLGSVAAIMINVTYGFSVSFMTGTAFYILGLLLFIMILRSGKKLHNQ
jgi:hypothetical protein